MTSPPVSASVPPASLGPSAPSPTGQISALFDRTGLHHPILVLEQPALRATSTPTGSGSTRDQVGLRWGKSGKQAQQAQEVIPNEPASKKAAIEELRRSRNAGLAASPPPPPSSHPGPLSPLSSGDTHGAVSGQIKCLFTSLAAKLKSRELMAGIRKAERLASQCKYQNAEHRARAAELHLQIARTQQMAPSSDGTSVI